MAALLIISAPSAQARGGLVFGSLQAAPTVGDDVYKLSALSLIGDNATTLYGSLSYGFGVFTEGRIRLGLSDLDQRGSDPTIALGAEFKYQFWNYSDDASGFGDPLDLSFSGMFEFADYNFYSTSSWGGSVIGSRSFRSDNGQSYGPYGRFNSRVATVDPTVGPSETDIEFALSPGFFYQFSSQLVGHIEFNFDDNSGVAFGFDFGPF
ncbi:MAG: hypothetical protein ACE5GA_07060 [Candidatus Zixiibacteriota bacterium]